MSPRSLPFVELVRPELHSLHRPELREGVTNARERWGIKTAHAVSNSFQILRSKKPPALTIRVLVELNAVHGYWRGAHQPTADRAHLFIDGFRAATTQRVGR